ncbi:hypothetical protein OG747_52955 (plasmid) [Streptomyces sp. NBC_01384]|uniref:WD40 repeat domain-containing protein n=1 Tax=Streptomyces sp. NBC_01384 TaxID=2903847 RepID=UPI00324E0F8E
MAQRTGQGASTLSQAAAGERLPTLPVVLAYVRSCGGDPEEWEERWREAALEAAAEPRTGDESAEPPYRGLARFEPGDADLFFGRDELTDRLVELARSGRFTAVFGPSGSGKSSLLRAGLIPRLRSPETAGPQPAAVRILTPGEHPLRVHEQRLIPKDADGETWLIVDQFEELYTLCTDPAERNQFIDRLLAATDPACRLRVVIAVRADFLGRCAEHPALTAALQDGTVLAGPMSRDELREAIVKPAQAAGAIVERALTSRILDDVEGEPGALPLMSHALLETWRRRKGRALTAEAYQTAGGLDGAIARTAEDVHAHLTPSQADLARRILLRLITPGEGTPDTRRPAPRTELDFGDPNDTTTVLEHLARARLVTLDEESVELAHEALITAWPRLKEWIDEDRQQLALHRRLTQDARAWDDLGRDAGALYRGVRLVTAEDAFAAWRAVELTRLEQAFLAASRARRGAELRRLRAFAGSLAVLLVLALVAGVIAWQQNAVSDRQRTQVAARRAAAVATSMRSSDPVKALQLAVAAWKTSHTPETRSALLGALTQREGAPFVPPTDADSEQFLSADGRVLVSAGAHRVTEWDVATRSKIGTFKGLGDQVNNLGDMTPDAQTLTIEVDATRTRLWDIREGRLRGPVMGPLVTPRWSGNQFSADGRTLIVAANDRMELWGMQPQRRLFTRRTSRDIADMAASPDGRFVALCPQNGSLELWDVRRHKRIPSGWFPKRLCARDPQNTARMEFSPDSRSLLVPDEQSIQRWDTPSGRQLSALPQPSLNSFAFSKDGRFIVSAGASEILLWRVSHPEAPVLRHPLVTASASDLHLDMETRQIRYVSDNLTAATIINSLDVGPAASPDWHKQDASYAVFSVDGNTMGLAWRHGGNEHFELRDAASGRVIATLPEVVLPPDTEGVELVELMSLSRDGRTFAYGMGSDSSGPSYPNTVRVWDVPGHREINHFTTVRADSASGLSGMLLSPDGRKLMTTELQYNGVTIRDVRRGKTINTLHYTKNGTTMGAGGELTAVRPDGGLLLTNSSKMISSPSGKEALDQFGDGNDVYAFSADGKYLAADDGDGRVTLWDGELHRRLGVLTGSFSSGRRDDQEEVAALAFSHDSSTLAVAGSQGTLQLWDVASHQLLGSSFPTPGDGILSVAFSQNDTTIYTAGEHVSWQKNVIALEQVAATVCERAGGPLSRTDWKTYLPEVPYRRTC